MLCIWWDQKSFVYYKLLAIPLSGNRYRLQLIRLSCALREKRSEYEQRHDKVILLHDNAWPHVAKVVKKYLKRSNGIFYRTCRILRTLLLLITDCSEGCSKSPVHFFDRNQKLAPKLDPAKTSHFFEMEFSKIA